MLILNERLEEAFRVGYEDGYKNNKDFSISELDAIITDKYIEFLEKNYSNKKLEPAKG